jgi:hypothetical protein
VAAHGARPLVGVPLGAREYDHLPAVAADLVARQVKLITGDR